MFKKFLQNRINIVRVILGDVECERSKRGNDQTRQICDIKVMDNSYQIRWMPLYKVERELLSNNMNDNKLR